MAKLRTYRLSNLALGYDRGANGSKDVSLPAMFCIVGLFCVSAVIAAPAQSTYFTTLASFDGANGASPNWLIQGSDGNFYGTAWAGGTNLACDNTSAGTVFKMTPSGSLTALYDFTGLIDGAHPDGLLQAADGNFYGTTPIGGWYECWVRGTGTAYSISAGGQFQVLTLFAQYGIMESNGPLIQTSDGNFYGTSSGGGGYGSGTVFKIIQWEWPIVLYSFCSQPDCTDGGGPQAGLVQASDGNFYGTTSGGGNYPYGSGTVFQITPAGVLTTLYSFCSQPNCADGSGPVAQLVQATDGNLYGTTQSGGTTGNGTVFKITPSGTLTTLYSFCSQLNCTDGANPIAGLLQASDGNLYGTTENGGAKGYGTVFEVGPSGRLTTTHSFCLQPRCADGAYPTAGLVQATDGNLYGTTWQGGLATNCYPMGCGIIFRLGVVRACATCRP